MEVHGSGSYELPLGGPMLYASKIVPGASMRCLIAMRNLEDGASEMLLGFYFNFECPVSKSLEAIRGYELPL